MEDGQAIFVGGTYVVMMMDIVMTMTMMKILKVVRLIMAMMILMKIMMTLLMKFRAIYLCYLLVNFQ